VKYNFRYIRAEASNAVWVTLKGTHYEPDVTELAAMIPQKYSH
jgi:hypothetical protein